MEWISVNEKLPEMPAKEILVFDFDLKKAQIVWSDDIDIKYHSHWMPLPDKPLIN